MRKRKVMMEGARVVDIYFTCICSAAAVMVDSVIIVVVCIDYLEPSSFSSEMMHLRW